jgi:hypothetical protein
MRVPAIIPVLTGQTPLTVRLVVHDIVRRMAPLQPDSEQWRTALWLASKALQWLHFNAAGFIDAGGAGEGAQRRLFATVWAAARRALPDYAVQELERFSCVTAPPKRCGDEYARVLSHPHQMTTGEVITHMQRALKLFDHTVYSTAITYEQRCVWRTLVLTALFDLIAANPDAMVAFGANFATVAYRKWAEVGEEWPFFMQAYPVEVLPRATQ